MGYFHCHEFPMIMTFFGWTSMKQICLILLWVVEAFMHVIFILLIYMLYGAFVATNDSF